MTDMTNVADIPLLYSGVASANGSNVMTSYLMDFISKAVLMDFINKAVSNMRVLIAFVGTCVTILQTVMKFLLELKQVYNLAHASVTNDMEKKSLKLDEVADEVVHNIDTAVEQKKTAVEQKKTAVEQKQSVSNTDEPDGVAPSTPLKDVLQHLSNIQHLLIPILNTYAKDNNSSGGDQGFDDRCFEWMRAVIKDIRTNEQSGNCSPEIQAKNKIVVDNIIKLLYDQGEALSAVMSKVGEPGCCTVCSHVQLQKTT